MQLCGVCTVCVAHPRPCTLTKICKLDWGMGAGIICRTRRSSESQATKLCRLGMRTRKENFLCSAWKWKSVAGPLSTLCSSACGNLINIMIRTDTVCGMGGASDEVASAAWQNDILLPGPEPGADPEPGPDMTHPPGQAKQLHFLAEQSREPGNRTFGMEFSGRNVLGRTFNDNRTDHHKINPIPDLIGSCGLQGVPLLLLYIHIH